MLFLLLIVFALKQQLDEQQFLQLVTFERSKILQSMGLVGSKSAVKLLARTAPKIYGQIAVQSIVQALKDPVQIEKLQHITHLTSLSFIMLNKGQNWIWAGLIQLLKPEDTVNQATQLLRLAFDAIQLHADLHALQKVKTVEELQTLHDRYVERYNYTRAMNFNRDCTLKYGSYPNAPLAETANILSLSSWDELMLEGKTMHHCVASYHASIASGKIFIYKVLEPQRLTLAIKRYGNNWAIDQVRAVCNGMPTDKALEAIQLWLGDAQNSLGTHLNTTLA